MKNGKKFRTMEILKHFWRYIVGSEYGFTGEGNEQWYYTVGIAINLMLVWCFKREIALAFTILAIIHYLTIFITGFFDFDYEDDYRYSFVYFGSHIILFVIAMIFSPKWAIITAIIPSVLTFIAPNCVGSIGLIDIYTFKSNNTILLFNTILFAGFTTITFILPMPLWVKIIIIIVALAIHPLIDYLEGECIIISDITYEACESMVKFFKKKKGKRK